MTGGFLLAFKSGDLKPCWTVKTPVNVTFRLNALELLKTNVIIIILNDLLFVIYFWQLLQQNFAGFKFKAIFFVCFRHISITYYK